MDIYGEIGQRIQVRRRELGMTQGKLAELVNLGRTSIVHIEAGKQQISVHHLVAIASELQLEPIDLLPAHQRRETIPREKLPKGERDAVIDAVRAAREQRDASVETDKS